MRKDLLIIALGLSLIAGRSGADVLSMPAGTGTADRASLPGKGTSMADVEKKYGEPSAKQATVGGDSAKHPPITRWDYAGFSVIFEKDRVIDAVIPGAPPAIYHKDELTPTASAPPMPGAAPAPQAPAAPAEPAPPAPGPETAAPAATPDNPNPDAPKQ